MINDNDINNSVDFEYPNDEDDIITEEDKLHDKMTELLRKLFDLILSSKKPSIPMVALFYVYGFDIGSVIGCDNDKKSISNKLGIHHHTLNLNINKVVELFDIKYTSAKLPKSDSYTGNKNNKYDNTVYSFKNILTNEIVNMSQNDFSKKYNISNKRTNDLIKGKQLSTHNWIII